MKITADGVSREFAEGSSYYELAQAFQAGYRHDILLVMRDNKLYELHKRCYEDAELSFITAEEKIGRMTYARSCIFLMLKAFRELETDRRYEVIVDFTLGGAYYCYLKDERSVSEALLQAVEAKMRAMQQAALPILKSSMGTDEAEEYFEQTGMRDKAELFGYRRTSYVNTYSLGNYKNYFYGFMVRDTSYLKYFELRPYREGFLLVLPEQSAPERLPRLAISDKLYEVQSRSTAWAQMLGVSTIALLNDEICAGRIEELIHMQEAVFEKQIGNIASQIARENKRLVMIAGPSSSGKTTFSHRLAMQLRALGLKPHPIAVDNYFRDRKHAPRDAEGNYDFESLECVDIERFNEDMLRLLAGETVELPRFNFIKGEREYKGDYLSLGEQDVLIMEGIHCLNEAMSYQLPKKDKFKIYISALTQINIDQHNRIPTTDVRLLRRMIRDNRTRGYAAGDTINMWKNVRRGEEENIFPFQESADVMINSAMIYELPVLKVYAEPLLFQIPKTHPAYQEAKRLLKFLDYVLPVSPEPIPRTSLVREFIGGSCIDVS